MTFASSMPTVRTGFEQFLLENFGYYTSVGNDAVIVPLAIALFALPLVRMLKSRATSTR